MMRDKYIQIFAILIIAASASLSAAAGNEDATPKGQLIVIIRGIQSDQAGQLLINLYRGEENWLKFGHEFLKKTSGIPAGDKMHIILTDVPLNQAVAIEVIHDRNNNGKLDFQWFPPKPKEGVGVSNNTFRMGPPDYNKAKIYLMEKATTIEINMHY